MGLTGTSIENGYLGGVSQARTLSLRPAFGEFVPTQLSGGTVCVPEVCEPGNGLERTYNSYDSDSLTYAPRRSGSYYLQCNLVHDAD
jgi:hypothetical protein